MRDALLDDIEDDSGPSMAGHTLAYLRKCFSWFESRTEWRSPIVRSMARGAGKARERVLDDAELRAVWKATEAPEPFHRLVRFILLTGARRSEAAKMPRSEINERVTSIAVANGFVEKRITEWALPAERNKTARS